MELREKLLPELQSEFAEKDPAEVSACLDAVLTHYQDAAVSTFVLPLAQREARDCLREDECALLANR
jgi:hypothetical protein